MRLSLLKRAFRRRFTAPLAPDVPFHAVGDIHGRADLLRKLLLSLERGAAPAARLVFVGDYVDRGDQSREVLDRLQALQRERPGAVICLMGNHERMLLDFLDEPEHAGPRWLDNGGLQTMRSYGVSARAQLHSRNRLEPARDAFRDALGPTEAWLRGLPLIWRSGNVAVVHAAADPSVPIDAQTDRTLLWGHRDFGLLPRRDGIWIVHGHTITERPEARAGRIAIDTGAYVSGVLTAAHVDVGKVTFR